MANPNIKATDSDGESLADSQIELEGRTVDELASGSSGTTDVSVEDGGSEVVSNLSVLDFVAGVSVTDTGNGEAQIDVEVDTSQIADGAVTTDKIDTAAVTAAKIAADAVGVDEIDLSITPTWTGTHTFDSTVTLADQSADPSANGELQRNGSDVKVYSGGAVRNLSNVGSGGTDTRTNVSDDDTTVVQDTEDINAGTGLDASADGDGTVTINAELSEGDGTSRQVWLISNGASDPAGANAEDLIFEEEA